MTAPPALLEGAHRPWYVGQVVDHLYASCPGLLRGLDGATPTPAPGVIYPEAGDVCGMCLRYWRARTGRLAPLTDMERELLLAVAAGLTRAAAARRLRISESSARGHLVYVLRKLGAPNAVSAVVIALKAGLIGLDDIDLPARATAPDPTPKETDR